MSVEAEIAVNAAIRRALHRIDRDDAQSSMRIARALVARCGDLGALDVPLVKDALNEVGFEAARQTGLSEDRFVEELLTEFEILRAPAGLGNQLRRFRDFAIRQLAHDIPAGSEAPARSHLQAFLEANYDTFREVETGRGQTDMLVGAINGEVIEVKLWKTQKYFEDGLTELAEYLRTERKPHGWYVVFDHSGAYLTTPRVDQQMRRNHVTIDVMWIAMPIAKASGLGAEIRKRHRSDEAT